MTFASGDPNRLAGFWAGMLARDAVAHGDGHLVPGSDTQLGLRFASGETNSTRRNPVHLHLTSNDLDDQRQTVARALELGASHLDVGQRPDEGHIVLADPEGNEFCVIEPGNNYLAGTGVLGELTCDGGPEVGHFWSQALGWPLVWEQDLQTAIQSPAGGTKLAWDGAPNISQAARGRHRFELVAKEDHATEVERLIELGATRLEGVDGTTLLADPDGTPFSCSAMPAD